MAEKQMRQLKERHCESLSPIWRCDGKVGVQNLVLAASAYWAHPDEPRWGDNADLATSRGDIGLAVLVSIAVRFGQNVP